MPFYRGKQRKVPELSVISILSDSELEDVKQPSCLVIKHSKERGVAVKKSKPSNKLIYGEDSDDQDFIDDSELVDDESDQRSEPLYYYSPVFLPYVDTKVWTGEACQEEGVEEENVLNTIYSSDYLAFNAEPLLFLASVRGIWQLKKNELQPLKRH